MAKTYEIPTSKGYQTFRANSKEQAYQQLANQSPEEADLFLDKIGYTNSPTPRNPQINLVGCFFVDSRFFDE